MKFWKGSALQIATKVVLLVFLISAGFSLLSAPIPGLAVIGMLIGFGFLANFATLPSGLLLVVLIGTQLILKRGVYFLLGGVLVVSVLGTCVYFGQQSLAGYEKVKKRVAYVAALPTKRFDPGKSLRIVRIEWSREPRCQTDCLRNILTGAIQSYVVSYGPKGRRWNSQVSELGFREYRAGKGKECRDQDSLGEQDHFSASLALYFLGGLCVISRELPAQPDGVWVLQDKDVKDRPDFKFRGYLTEIVLRENGHETLLSHNEAGIGSYQSFPPMFIRWFSSESTRVYTEWLTFGHAYGTEQDWKVLVESVTGASFAAVNFPEPFVPVILDNIASFESGYSQYGDQEKSRVFRSISILLHEMPDLFERLEPLILRGIDDVDVVARAAIDTLRLVSKEEFRGYIPVISKQIHRPALSSSITSLLLRFPTTLPSEDLVSLAKASRQPDPRGSSPYSNLFKLLKNSGKNGEDAVAYMLQVSPYRDQETAACWLIDRGRKDLVAPHSYIFEMELKYMSWRTKKVRRGCNAQNILVDLGLEDKATAIIKKRLSDPALSKVDRGNLKNRLTDLWW